MVRQAYMLFSKFVPGIYKKKIKDLLKYSGISKDEDEFIGETLFKFSILSVLCIPILVHFMVAWQIALVCIAVIIVPLLLSHLFLVYTSDSRSKFSEKVLPDVLLLTASNIRAGMLPDEAFISSARSEFGPLAEHIRSAGKEILSGSSFEAAFKSISENIDSESIKRSVELILEGIESGGELAKLLEETANDLRGTESLKKMIQSNVKSYLIFILFAAGIGAPLLFGISTFLVEVLLELSSEVSVPEATSNLGFISLSGFSTITLESSFFVGFAWAAMAITSVFGGLALGIISSGNQKDGIKYIPILMFLCYVIFTVVRILVSSAVPSFV